MLPRRSDRRQIGASELAAGLRAYSNKARKRPDCGTPVEVCAVAWRLKREATFRRAVE